MRHHTKLTKRYMLAAGAASVALAFGVAHANNHLPSQHVVLPHIVAVGDYGHGTPLPSEEEECAQAAHGARVVQDGDVWRCLMP